MRLKLLSENLDIATGILVIGSQRVNKQSADFRLTQTFSHSIYLEFMEKEENSRAALTSAVFRTR